MAGNQDRAAGDGADLDAICADLGEGLRLLRQGMIQTPPGAGEPVKLAQYAGMLDRVARAALSVARLTESIRRPAGHRLHEDEMSIDDRDDSPENLERLRGSLEPRLRALAAAFEAKGLAFVPGGWPVARPGGAAGAAASRAPDSG
ncbi:hypothetical protein GVN24_34235 [Rhizobium sp. CRIBSB]|nr:hypothetical protein [Rhizobium sp. CRIBSB]